MLTIHRLLALCICVLVLVPLAAVSALPEATKDTGLSWQADDRYRKTEEIRQLVESVPSSPVPKVRSVGDVANKKVVLSEAEVQLQKLARDKRVVRLQLAAVLAQERDLQERGIDSSNPESVLELLLQEKNRMRFFLRSVFTVYASQSTAALGALLGQTLVNQSLGERTEASIRTRAILNAREDLLTLLRQAQEVPEFLTQLRSQHEALLAQYTVAQKEYDTAGERLHMSAASPEEMQRTVTEVNAQIAKLQSELARIDARLRRTAERALIEKGLMSPKEGEYSGGKIVGDKARLSWPAVGRISAGFYNKSYQQFFGFPHKGIDIVVSQGSAVRAAADGVVFLSRFGGAKGYSYILIGHQGGTATLYGHLSQLSVSSGQEVHRGQVIGFSGGSPGTVGAGPMTTGAHLHFEVIQNGRHVNPQSVLP